MWSAYLKFHVHANLRNARAAMGSGSTLSAMLVNQGMSEFVMKAYLFSMGLGSREAEFIRQHFPCCLHTSVAPMLDPHDMIYCELHPGGTVDHELP